jgi:hypothetical protein
MRTFNGLFDAVRPTTDDLTAFKSLKLVHSLSSMHRGILILSASACTEHAPPKHQSM